MFSIERVQLVNQTDCDELAGFVLEQLIGMRPTRHQAAILDTQVTGGKNYLARKIDSAEPAGFASLYVYYGLPEAELRYLYVVDKFRGMQLGKILIERVTQKAADCGAEKLWLCPSDPSSIDLHLFYSKLGFVREEYLSEVQYTKGLIS